MAIKKTNKTVKETTKKETNEVKTKKSLAKDLSFDDEDVDALEPLEAIRKRYDMYCGSLDPVTHMVKELFDNSIDEFSNGFCKEIAIEINTKDNNISVRDDGRGLPLGINAKLKQPTMQVLFTHVHAGSKYNKKSVKTSAGKNGVGIKTITACCEWAKAVSVRDGETACMEFSRGKITKDFTKTKLTKKSNVYGLEQKGHGTYVQFKPDASLFGEEDAILKPEKIRNEINLKCYLNAGLKVYFILDGKKEIIQYNLGLSDFLNTEIKTPLYNMENVVFKRMDGDNTYQIALSFENSTDENIKSFVNSLPTLRGTHETGFKKGLTKAFNEYIKNNGLLNKKGDKGLQIKGEDIRRGLVAIISLNHTDPMFDGQTKSELTNKDIDGITSNIVFEEITKWFEENPALAKKLTERAVAFARATNNAKEAMKKIVKVSSSSLGLSITEKFKDCTSDNPDDIEIYVIEGDSAGGNVEQGRFSEFQCVFPLKGKIKNTYRNKQSTLINSNEINEFLKVMFGTNDIAKIKQMFANDEIDKVIKGKKIIILTDADPDGSHICILFLNFIYEHLPELIEKGYLYIGLSPFYRVNVGTSGNVKWRYFMNDYEYNQFVSEIIGKRYKVMNPKYNINRVLMNADAFIEEFEKIMHKYTVDADVMNAIIRNDEVANIRKYLIEELNLKEDGSDNYEELYNNIWHSFNLDELMSDMTDLCEIFPFQTLILNDKNEKEEYEFDIYDGLLELKSIFKYVRNRIKGLGELDSEELRETSLDPEKRTLIQVKADKDDTEVELFKILFGPNPDLRKEFIGKYLL